MECFYHQGVPAAAQCSNCGKYICSSCCMQDYSTMKIYCPDCASSLQAYYNQQQQNQEYAATQQVVDYRKVKKKWAIMYAIELILSFFFYIAGFAYAGSYSSIGALFSKGSFWDIVIFLSIGGIPGAIFGAIWGRPTTNEEKLVREVQKIRYDDIGCIGSLIYLVLCGILGNLITILSAVCLIIVIIQLAQSKKAAG